MSGHVLPLWQVHAYLCIHALDRLGNCNLGSFHLFSFGADSVLVPTMQQRQKLSFIISVHFQVPLPILSPYEVQQVVTQSGAPQAARLQGVCTSVSSVTKQVRLQHMRAC